MLNRLEERLSRTRKVPIKTIVFKLPCPQLVEIAGRSGIDFAIIDLEHSSTGLDTLEYAIALGQGIPMPVLVRVDDVNNHQQVHKVLDMGASGIIFPAVTNRDETELAVKTTRFPPLGNRGASSQSRATHYSAIPWGEYCAQANKETIVWILVESREAVENIDSIVSVDGVDAVWIGLGDMALSYNAKKVTRDTVMDPVLEAAVDKVINASSSAGVSVVLPGYPKYLGNWMKRGVHIYFYGTDVSLFFTSCKQIVNELP